MKRRQRRGRRMRRKQRRRRLPKWRLKPRKGTTRASEVETA